MCKRKNMAIRITTCICGEGRTWPYSKLLVYVEKKEHGHIYNYLYMWRREEMAILIYICILNVQQKDQ